MKFFNTIFIVSVALLLMDSSQAFGAGITVSLTPVSVAAGSSGDAFDVDITNGGPSAVTVGGFSFELSIANSNISLTAATTSTTAAYIFAADSLFGPNLTTLTTGQLLDASDIASISLAGTSLTSGETLGLGRVFFNVAPNAAPGVTTVNISAFPATTLSDANGNNLAIGTLSPGQITILGSTVPEPSSFVPLSLFFASLAVYVWLKRAPKWAPSTS